MKHRYPEQLETRQLLTTTQLQALVFATPTVTDVASRSYLLSQPFLLNSDEFPDLVMADFNGDAKVLLGDGSGRFIPHTTLKSSTRIESVAFGDLNNDGLADIVLGGEIITPFVANENGNWSATDPILGPGESISLYDLDNDGTLDLISRNLGSTVHVRMGAGDGFFSDGIEYTGDPVETAPRSVGLEADLNGDGFVDIVRPADQATEILFNDGTGTFDEVLRIQGIAHPMVLHDLNGDNQVDLIAAKIEVFGGAFGPSGKATITTHLGQADGTFGEAVDVLEHRGFARGLSVADITGDGIVDLLLHEEEVHFSIGNGPIAAPGNGDGSFREAVQVTATSNVDRATGPVVIDVDADGVNEVVNTPAFRPDGDSLNVYRRGEADVFATLATNFEFSERVNLVLVRDFNGDQLPDLVAQGENQEELLVRLGIEDGFAAEVRMPDTQPISFRNSQAGFVVTNNPLVQFIVNDDLFTTLEIRTQSESGETSAYVVPAFGELTAHDSAHIDVDHDGDLDFVQGHYGGVFVLWGVGKGDLNRNGKVDSDDIQRLREHKVSGNVDVADVDLTGDGVVDETEDYAVRTVAGTRAGDANFDRKVDFRDFLALAANFGKVDSTWAEGDFNGDGTANFADFLILAENFGYAFKLPTT